jgi:hypothetical protein
MLWSVIHCLHHLNLYAVLMHHLKEIRLMPYNAEPWETFSDIPPCTNLTKTYLKASKPSDNSVLISDTFFHCTFARLQWNSIPGPIFSVHSTWLWYTIMTKDRLRSKASSQVAMAVVTGINVQDYSLSRMAFMPWVSALDWYDSYYCNNWNILVSSGSSLPCLLSRTTCSASPPQAYITCRTGARKMANQPTPPSGSLPVSPSLTYMILRRTDLKQLPAAKSCIRGLETCLPEAKLAHKRLWQQ